MLSLLLVACAPAEDDADTAEVTAAGECLPTYGDQCACEPQCMTQAEIDEVVRGLVCDLGCLGELDWACVRDERGCQVVDE